MASPFPRSFRGKLMNLENLRTPSFDGMPLAPEESCVHPQFEDPTLSPCLAGYPPSVRVTSSHSGLPLWLSSEESTCQCRRCGFHPRLGKIPWRRKWQCPPVCLPRTSHGQRNLVGYGPWGHCKQLGVS